MPSWRCMRLHEATGTPALLEAHLVRRIRSLQMLDHGWAVCRSKRLHLARLSGPNRDSFAPEPRLPALPPEAIALSAPFGTQPRQLRRQPRQPRQPAVPAGETQGAEAFSRRRRHPSGQEGARPARAGCRENGGASNAGPSEQRLRSAAS